MNFIIAIALNFIIAILNNLTGLYGQVPLKWILFISANDLFRVYGLTTIVMWILLRHIQASKKCIICEKTANVIAFKKQKLPN